MTSGCGAVAMLVTYKDIEWHVSVNEMKWSNINFSFVGSGWMERENVSKSIKGRNEKGKKYICLNKETYVVDSGYSHHQSYKSQRINGRLLWYGGMMVVLVLVVVAILTTNNAHSMQVCGSYTFFWMVVVWRKKYKKVDRLLNTFNFYQK